ncbi:MAG: NAD(P)H-binding protein, partial [Proteobacteria bacterium]|nr:NAD(P)H-binding protein [Pseudomonadota bacterium]
MRPIIVYGATGLVGRSACATLAAIGVPFVAVARRSEGLETIRGARETRVASIYDGDGLIRAFAGASVVLCAAGPLRETAEPVLAAAIAAGASYVDVGGEQPALRTLHERHDAAVRRAGLVALPGAGLDCAIGDLAAAWGARVLIGASSTSPNPNPSPTTDDDLMYREPPERLAEDHPLDEVCTSYLYDDFALSAGSQRALFGSVGDSAITWRAERWEPVRSGARRRVNVRELGGEREAIAFGGGDAITVPRHID